MSSIIPALKIDRIAGLGDGIGLHEGRKIFVPYTAAGDVINARITKETSDVTYGTIEKILSPSPHRITPVCRHFGTCGGCTLQHIDAPTYTDFKLKTAQEAVRKAGFDESCVTGLITLPANSRRRVDLKAANGKLGFYAERSHNIVDIEDCKVLEPELLELILQLKKPLTALPGTSRIQINGVDDGYDILIEGIEQTFSFSHQNIRRISLRKGSTIKTIHQSGPVTIELGAIKVEVPPGAFLQASRQAQQIMTELVKNAVSNSHNVLDLFAGIGTYSFPIAATASVTAIEGEKSMVDAMQNVARKHNITSKFKAELRDLFHHPVPGKTLSHYDTIILNPPRAGAKAQTEELARSNIRRIVMVSCNPATFTRDARILKEAGYSLQKLTPIDQFTYSSHLELVAEFTQ